jgi:DNA primase
MARYTQDSIERVREAVDMVALISKRADLRRVGMRWIGLCPFHDERTPSFSVEPERGLYYCFGCGEGGDAFKFVQAMEGLDFPEAVELLAEERGVELRREREDPREEERRQRRERLLTLVERTAAFYATFLWESEEASKARGYLLGRGLTEEVLRAFRVGYAPSAWDRVLTAARRDGFTEDELRATGLAQRGRSGGLYDRFRKRITFPLADSRGKVLGFGARAMGDDQQPKYLNTAEGELYHKGRQLFGIDRARAAIAKSGRVVVVEGYTDVLALHVAGIEETVGIMGTALTEEQMAELSRAAGVQGTVFLALDADRSGQEAMLRAARMAAKRDVELRVVVMPEGTDPAELVHAEGGEEIAVRLDRSLSVLEFEVGRVLDDADLDRPEGRDRALVAARGLIAEAPARSARRDHLVGLVADRLDVPAAYVTATGDGPPAPAVAAGRTATPSRAPAAAALEAERVYLADCLGAGAAGRQALERLTPGHLSAGALLRARDHLVEHFDDPLADLPRDDSELATLVIDVARRAEEGAPADAEKLRMDFLALEARRLEREIRSATREGKLDRQRQLAAAKQRVRDEMEAAMGQAS